MVRGLIFITVVVTTLFSTTHSIAQWQDIKNMNVNGNILKDNHLYQDAHAKSTEIIYGTQGGSFDLELKEYYSHEVKMCLCTSSTNTSNWANGYLTGDYMMKYDKETYFKDLKLYHNGTLLAEIEDSNIDHMKIEVFGDQVRFYNDDNIIYTLIDNNIPTHLRGLVMTRVKNTKVKARFIHFTDGVPLSNTWYQKNDNLYYNHGSIGIGNNNPNSLFRLDVSGKIRGSGGESDQWNEAYAERGSVIAGEGLSWSNGQLAVSQPSIWDDNASTISYTGGAVGIGSTTVPSNYLLFVDGPMGVEELVVEIVPGTGPDYVFEEDYDLSSLEEIDQYIEANGHLPEVPSALEMEAQGVSVGEMNMLLLRKVEELTLHLIELNGKYDKVNSELQKIRNTSK